MADNQTLAEVVASIVGGAGATIVGALAGRLMYHVGEVRKMKRKFFGKEMLWEVPIVVGMAFIGDGAASYLSLTSQQALALVAILAYLGPRWVHVLLERKIDTKIPDDGG